MCCARRVYLVGSVMTTATERRALEMIQQDEREAEFTAMVREYLADTGYNAYGDGRKYRFGGAINLIVTVRLAFEARYTATGCEDYKRVADALTQVEAMANLPYDELEAA